MSMSAPARTLFTPLSMAPPAGEHRLGRADAAPASCLQSLMTNPWKSSSSFKKPLRSFEFSQEYVCEGNETSQKDAKKGERRERLRTWLTRCYSTR